MNGVQIVVIGIIAVVFAGLAIAMSLAISRNFNSGKEFRQRLYQRLKQLPYKDMLARRDIEIDSYLAGTMVKDIRSQLANCEGCEATHACQEALNCEDNNSEEDYSFCPNDRFFEEYEKKTTGFS